MTAHAVHAQIISLSPFLSNWLQAPQPTKTSGTILGEKLAGTPAPAEKRRRVPSIHRGTRFTLRQRTRPPATHTHAPASPRKRRPRSGPSVPSALERAADRTMRASEQEYLAAAHWVQAHCVYRRKPAASCGHRHGDALRCLANPWSSPP